MIETQAHEFLLPGLGWMFFACFNLNMTEKGKDLSCVVFYATDEGANLIVFN